MRNGFGFVLVLGLVGSPPAALAKGGDPGPAPADDSAAAEPAAAPAPTSPGGESGPSGAASLPTGGTAAPGATTTEMEKAPEPASQAPAAAATTPTEQAYDLKIRNLEEKVNDLKEKIFRSKARLILLKETVLHGSISGAKAVLYHRNEMGSSFRLEQVIYSLDGKPIYKKVDNDGDLADKEEFEIFNGSIVPGNHNISVFMVYRGHGYGIFSYLKGYVFKIRSSFAFNAEEGRIVRIKAVGYEKGGITTDLKERPDVRFDMEVLKEEPDGSGGAGSAGAKL